MNTQRVKIVEGGKLVIPAMMRRELGIVAGDTVMVDIENGELRVRTIGKAIERARAILRRHASDDAIMPKVADADPKAGTGHD